MMHRIYNMVGERVERFAQQFANHQNRVNALSRSKAKPEVLAIADRWQREHEQRQRENDQRQAQAQAREEAQSLRGQGTQREAPPLPKDLARPALSMDDE